MTTKSTFSEYALYILDTVKASCSLAEIFKAKGDLKSARELLDGVSEILDRLTYLDDRRRNYGK